MFTIEHKPANVSPEMWAAWKEWEHTYKTKIFTGVEKYDPNTHLPELFKQAPDPEEQAVTDGIARRDEYGNIVYDYEKLLKRDGIERKKKAQRAAVEDPLDALIREADQRAPQTGGTIGWMHD